MSIRRYLAEEIALDAAAGHLSRREALRRLGLVGLSTVAATALLAACGDDDDATEDGAAAPRTTEATTPPSTTAPALTEAVTFAGSQGQLQGTWASPTDPKGGVLLVHENRGLTEYFRTLPRRFAEDGYAALTVDLLSPEGGTASLDEGEAVAALGNAPEERLVADLRAGVDELERRLPGKKLAVVGFCFGGGMVWRLLDAGEDRLAVAVPFYGTPPDDPDFSVARAAVLAVYAERDSRVNATRDAAVTALRAAGLTHEVRTYPGVDHAFFNETGPRYDATAAREAYMAMLDWFERHLT